MTPKEFFDVYRGKPVLYKGKDIGAYVAGYVEDKLGNIHAGIGFLIEKPEDKEE